MKPLHHYLRRFCSEQVQILLERMDNHFGEEFAGNDTKWEIYTNRHGRAYDYYTKIEAYCVAKTCKEQYAIYQRQQMLNGILERTMSRAVRRWDYAREQQEAINSKVLTTAELAQQARSILGQQLQAAYQQNETSEQLAQYQASQHQAQHIQLHNKLRNWLTQ